MSLPAWPDWTEEQWREARKNVLKWDENKHPREPKGGPGGGQFTEGVGHGP